jgi:hypothetical protein
MPWKIMSIGVRELRDHRRRLRLYCHRRRMSLLSGERMTIRLRYLTWKLRALCWVLRRLRAGR